jgi:hypothetical protein
MQNNINAEISRVAKMVISAKDAFEITSKSQKDLEVKSKAILTTEYEAASLQKDIIIFMQKSENKELTDEQILRIFKAIPIDEWQQI